MDEKGFEKIMKKWSSGSFFREMDGLIKESMRVEKEIKAEFGDLTSLVHGVIEYCSRNGLPMDRVNEMRIDLNKIAMKVNFIFPNNQA